MDRLLVMMGVIVMAIGNGTFADESPTVIQLFADTAKHVGTMVATTRPAHSGEGYATGFDSADDRVQWRVKAAAPGLYAVNVRYSTDQLKRFELAVNDVAYGQFFKPTDGKFADHAAGKVELKAGENIVEIRNGWGYFDIDRVELTPTTLPTILKPSTPLCDPHASMAAKALYEALVENYGQQTLSGAFGLDDVKIVEERAGVTPAIIAEDLMDYSPSRRPFYPNFVPFTAKLLETAKAKKQIVTLSWHWTAPRGLIDGMIEVDGKPVSARWYEGYNANATTFDFAAALADENSDDYKLLLRDIDVIAAELKKFADADVPVLWRPLHEADGKWFWWGAKGPEAFKELWSLLFHRLRDHHGLHNLIWVYTGTDDFDWYPPANQFDIIGVDFYPTDSRETLSAMWDSIQSKFDGQKLIALSEFGGVPDLHAMARVGVRWSYFASWSGSEGPAKHSAEELKTLYTAPTVVNAQR